MKTRAVFCPQAAPGREHRAGWVWGQACPPWALSTIQDTLALSVWGFHLCEHKQHKAFAWARPLQNPLQINNKIIALVIYMCSPNTSA